MGDGSMPADFGFDPLSLGSDVNSLNWFREAELQHCRWAMLGVTGILVGEIVRPDIDFYKAPQQLGDSLPFPMPTLLAIEFILFHYVELRRWQDFKKMGALIKIQYLNRTFCLIMKLAILEEYSIHWVCLPLD